jgi:adenylosuccinate lyase
VLQVQTDDAILVMSTLSSIGSFFEDILTGVRELIAGESFKVHEDSEGADVRG